MLRVYWFHEKPRPKTWIFPGYGDDIPMVRHTPQRMIAKARIDAGIKKMVTTHTLRHTCDTHMLEDGENIRTIQLLLGHRSLRTTGKYLHVSGSHLKDAKTPLDSLDLK